MHSLDATPATFNIAIQTPPRFPPTLLPTISVAVCGMLLPCHAVEGCVAGTCNFVACVPWPKKVRRVLKVADATARHCTHFLSTLRTRSRALNGGAFTGLSHLSAHP